MGRTVQARLDDAAEAALGVLRRQGHTDSEAVRLALVEAADRRRRRSMLAAEAQIAATDEIDLAVATQVREEMDRIAAPWPAP